MKKIIIIAISCILTLSSFLFTACEKRIDNNENKSSEQTTAQTQNNTVNEEKPMPIPSVKGKNGRQLFEDAMSSYTSSTTFDIAMTMESTENGTKTTEKMEYKIGSNSMYFDIEMGEQDMTIWFVDNTLYLEMGDEKYKAANTNIADVLGENFFDELLSELPTDISDIPEAYMKKMESAQIYSYKGTYYFSVTVTDEEAVEMELGEKGYTETMYFDSNGAIKKIVAKDAKETMTVLINSYGKDVEISTPENADEFVEKPIEEEAGPGVQDHATYAVYEDILDTLRNATSYIMSIEMNERPYIFYEVDAVGGKYTAVLESESIYEMWLVNGQGYVCINNDTPLKTNELSTILKSMESAESTKDYITESPIHGDEMSHLTISNTSNSGEKNLSFSVIKTDLIYTYSFTYAETYVDVFITKFENGETETLKYIFDFDFQFRVTAPI